MRTLYGLATAATMMACARDGLPSLPSADDDLAVPPSSVTSTNGGDASVPTATSDTSGDSLCWGVNSRRTFSQPNARIGSPLTMRWRSPVVGSSVSLGLPEPLIVGGTVYLVTGLPFDVPSLLALDGASGRSLWAATGDWAPPLDLASDGPRIFVANRRGLVALDARTGAKLWTWTCAEGDCNEAPPVAGDGIVYVQTPAETVAIDAATGTMRWMRPATGTSAFALDDGRLYGFAIATPCWQLVALDAASGGTEWSSCLGDTEFPRVAVSAGRLFSVWDSTVVVRDKATGIVAGQYGHAFPTAFDGALGFFVSDEGVIAVNALTGAVAWKATPEPGWESMCWDLAVAGKSGQLFVLGRTTGTVYELDEATGEVRSSAPTAPQDEWGCAYSGTGFALSDDTLVVSTENGTWAF